MSKNILKSFSKLREKHICHSLFFNKVAGWKPKSVGSSRWTCSVKKDVLNPFTPTRYSIGLKMIQLAFCKPSGGVKTISKESFPYVT